jgi:DNA-binding CsgD family transcriptional regulator
MVRESFGLSPAELRLAEAICNGMSLDEFAANNGTSLNTVRSQAKQIFAKTGVRRQVELPKCLMPYLWLR